MLRRLVLILTLLLAALPALAQEGGGGGSDDPELTPAQKKEADALDGLQRKASEAIEAKDYKTAAEVYRELCAKLDQSTLPADGLVDFKQLDHYNYACCLSRIGAKDDAIKEFAKSVDAGYFEWDHIAKDDDLDAIRELDAFKKAVDDGKKLEIDRLVAQVKENKPPFEFALKATTLDGKKVTLEDWKGKVLAIQIVEPATDETFEGSDVLAQALKDLKDKGFDVLGVSVGADSETTKATAERKGWALPLATSKTNAAIKAAFLHHAHFIIIDKDGKVRVAARGIFQAEALEKAVAPLLAGEASGAEKK
jgi:peroxiredoxin